MRADTAIEERKTPDVDDDDAEGEDDDFVAELLAPTSSRRAPQARRPKSEANELHKQLSTISTQFDQGNKVSEEARDVSHGGCIWQGRRPLVRFRGGVFCGLNSS